jgi:protease-4
LARWSAGKIVGITFLCIFVLLFFSGGCYVAGLLSSTFSRASYKLGDAIYEIRLEGVISAEKYSSLLMEETVTPEEMMSQLDEAESNPIVKAILIRVNSPGGSAAASQEIYEELKKVEKPVVVSVSETCASGAYYISTAADRIIANRSSSVGSIGVITKIPNFEGLFEQLGIEYVTIKQGEFKDVGSIDRPITEEEASMLEAQLKEIYEQFISDVADSRGMDISDVRELATGWVFLGTEALDLGLIDEIGNYKDAIEIAAELGGIKGEPVIIKQQYSYSLMDLIFDYYLNMILERIF